MRRRVESPASLLTGIEKGQKRALGRAASMLEDRSDGYREILQVMYGRTGDAKVVGITGPPGVGKSTLVDRMARGLRARGREVAILAVDPSSPFTGGALLGDRVRMQGAYDDPAVFIRSMATRGVMGGLARATRDVIDLLDGAGFDWILVETVGVGQDETDVVRTVDVVVVVTVPGLGDDIQAIKAGIMEIADLFVVNKSDRDGADRAVGHLESAITMVEGEASRIPILQTVAVKNEGVEELLETLEKTHVDLTVSGGLEERRFQSLRIRVEEIMKERFLNAARDNVDLEAELRRAFKDREDPYAVSDRLFAGVVAEVSSTSERSEV